ncbi:MAG: MFS transporter [Oscillospiraceae bacterium]|nr:MFS transporter [Oscillospiraceae bacterium]
MSEPIIGIHRAKTWQIGLFALNDVAINFYWMMMTFMAFYLQGVLGLTVALASFLLAALNIFDGITDPIIGYIMDKTSGKFGKFRPFMAVGNLVMAISLTALYFTSYASGTLVLALVIASFIVYDIGLTLQANVTRSAITVLTNDPKQRPTFAAFSTAFSVLLAIGVAMLVSNLLEPMHGGLNIDMFRHFFIIVIIASAFCTILAIIGIRTKDRPKYYGVAPESAQKVRFRECIGVLKHNKNVLMLVVCASTDRLFSHIATNAVIMVMIFGIISGDYAQFGQSSMLVAAPSIGLALLTTIWYARKYGQKSALLFASKGAMIANVVIFLAFVFLDPTTLDFAAWTTFTIVFFVGLAVRGGFMTVGSRIVIPMIADCADHEVYRSGKYVPGTISGLFTFVDKVFGSLNVLIVGGLLIIAGYGETFPTPDTPYSSAIFIIAMICYIGLPMLGWIINLIALRFYDLTPEKMNEIRMSKEKKHE